MKRERINIVNKVKKSFQSNRQRLIEFFQNQDFDIQQAEELTSSMRNAVYFLETHEYERADIEIEIRKGIREGLKKEIKELKSLAKHTSTLKKLVPDNNWEEIFELQMHQYESHKFFTTRAGKNKSLEMALEPLFWRLQKFGKGQTKQVDIVYRLFVEYDLDDYGQEYSTKDVLIGEKEQKERIRIHFQQKAVKERKKYSELFGW